MFAIQLYIPDEDEALWPKKEKWKGIKISTLKEILPLINELTQD
jgi:hypothetical protein